MSEQIKNRLNKKPGYYLISITTADSNVVFKSSADYQFFLSLFRYLLPGRRDEGLIGSDLVNYSGSVVPLVYGLHPTDCEILVCCRVNGDEAKFTNDLMSLYAAYFFDKYKQNLIKDYQITRIDEVDLLDTSRAIHTKPPDWRTYQHSSLRAYMYDDGYDWLDCNFIKSLGYTTGDYLRYLES